MIKLFSYSRMALKFDYSLNFLKDIFTQSTFELPQTTVTEALGFPPVKSSKNNTPLNNLRGYFENAREIMSVELPELQKDITKVLDSLRRVTSLVKGSNKPSKFNAIDDAAYSIKNFLLKYSNWYEDKQEKKSLLESENIEPLYRKLIEIHNLINNKGGNQLRLDDAKTVKELNDFLDNNKFYFSEKLIEKYKAFTMEYDNINLNMKYNKDLVVLLSCLSFFSKIADLAELKINITKNSPVNTTRKNNNTGRGGAAAGPTVKGPEPPPNTL